MFSGPPGLPQLFTVEYLGTKKITAMFHANRGCFDSMGGPEKSTSSMAARGNLFSQAGLRQLGIARRLCAIGQALATLYAGLLLW